MRARAWAAVACALLAALLLALPASADPPEGRGQPADAGRADDAGQGNGQGAPPEEPASPGQQGAAPPSDGDSAPASPPSSQPASEPAPAPAPDASSGTGASDPPGQADAATAAGQPSGSAGSPPEDRGDHASPRNLDSGAVPDPVFGGEDETTPTQRSGGGDAAAAAPGLASPEVQHVPEGNHLAWDAASLPSADTGAVLVQREVNGDWVTVATLPAGTSTFLDAGAPVDATYRLAWDAQVALPRGPDVLAAPLATLAPGLAPAGATGMWLVGLLWGAIAAIATVRVPTPPAVQDTRVTRDHLLLSALAGLPDIDAGLVQRVQSLGLRTVGQLRAVDAQTLAFWTNIPAATFRCWQEAAAMLEWPALPTGTAQRLVMAGTSSLAEVAQADPQRLYAELHDGRGIGTAGPGLPQTPKQVEEWVTAARHAVRQGVAPPLRGMRSPFV